MPTNRLSVATATPTTTFRLQADRLSSDADENESVVRCYLTSATSPTGNYNWHDATVRGTVNGTSFTVSGTSADYSSGQDKTWGPFDITVPHDADGTKVASLALFVSYPHAADTGGTASGTLTLPTLTVAPEVPSGLSFTRNSDTQATCAWTNEGATNGQPTSNQIQTSVNGAGFSQVASIAAAESLVVAVAANQKVVFRVRETNSVGSSAYSDSSDPVYTTPAAPTGVAAAKNADLDIVVSWTPHVGYTEHTHVVEHGTITSGVTTWDASPLASVAAGTSSYKHVDPDASKVHVYRVSAKTTDTSGLQSSKVVSNSVQLLVAPNKPTLPALGPYEDAAEDFVLTWTHNPVDTTPQTAYEVGYSTDGGSTWASTGKTTDTDSEYTFAGGTYESGDALTVRVRTWGQATSGGADGAGASPWSDSATVTFKTAPVVTILSPEDGSTWDESALTVELGFSQAEDASFVRATIVLSEGDTVLETKTSTTLASTVLDTRVDNGGSYSLSVTVLDSNGLTSPAATADFDVAYTLPVEAAVTVTYLPDQGWAQVGITIPDPGDDEAAAVALMVSRTVDGVTETVQGRYTITDATVQILDTTPVTYGTNDYTVTTISADGATVGVAASLTTADDGAFLSTGPGYATVIRFRSNLQVAAAPTRNVALVPAAGRSRPIALFGDTGTLTVTGTASLLPGTECSTPQEVEAFLLTAGRVCYRDPTGRRMFGVASGSLSTPWVSNPQLEFSVSEAS